MNRINEYNLELEPGTYEHYKGTIYVVLEMVTHMDGAGGKMEALVDPLVCYRDLIPIVKHVNGRPIAAHQVYARPLSEFMGMVDHPASNGQMVKRFKKM